MTLTREELERYDRQIRIIGPEGQEKLKNTKVLVVGAGGLGSAVLFYLVASGIGNITVVDHGIVELSNLNRQILYTPKDVGKPKVHIACEKLREFNPYVDIVCISRAFNEELGRKLIPKVDVVVDALDNWESRFLLNRLCVEYRKPLVHAGIEGFYGQITVIVPGVSPCLNCLMLRPPKMKETIPVVSVTAGVLGLLQVNEVLKLALSIGKPLIGRMMIVDLLNNEYRIIELKRNPKCPICSRIS